MSNIDINLIRARDGAAPQHKVSNANKFELTEGSDGAQHVKIVDSEGNLQDKISVEFPDKQIVTVDNQIQLPTDYPDKEVEARLQAIEQTQSQILDKLNDTIDTRLTRSIVELYKSDSVEMESNSRINLIDITEMKKKHVIASIRARDSHDFLLDVDWRTSATGSVGYSVGAEQLIKSDNELSSKTENYISTKTNVARFRLENNSDEIQRNLSIINMGVD